jgi:hypothetical protein
LDLRKIKLRQEYRKCHMDLNNNYSVSSTVQITKEKNFRWAAYAEDMGQTKRKLCFWFVRRTSNRKGRK